MIDNINYLTNMDLNYIYREINSNGFALLPFSGNENNLILFAENFGKILADNNGKLIQTLKVTKKGTGILGSFSYIVGEGAFPWHTDTAFWDVPARYIILYSINPSKCPTNYIKFEDIFTNKKIFYKLADKALFTLNLPSLIRVIPFKFNYNIIGYRYDQHIMKPYNQEAKKLDYMIREGIAYHGYTPIEWDGKIVAIIDNWYGVHNRSTCFDEPERKLLRVYIG